MYGRSSPRRRSATAGYRGCCAVALDEHAQAISVLEEACSAAAGSRWQSYTARIDLGAAYARHSDFDKACALLTDTLGLASQTRLREIVRRVRNVYENELASRSDLAEIRQLDEQSSRPGNRG